MQRGGGGAGGTPFGSDSRDKSLQLWASPSKWGQVSLIIPKFKVFPAHLSQPGRDASRSTVSDGDLNVPSMPVKHSEQEERRFSHPDRHFDVHWMLMQQSRRRRATT